MLIQTTENLTSQAVTPLLQAMLAKNDSLPKNSLPVNTQGTIQENADEAALPSVTLYNAHGILRNSNPNTLIARV